MALFKLFAGTAKGKSWKAVGIHPLTGRTIILHGGQKGVDVTNKTPQQVEAFVARHEAGGISPKIYINALRWSGEISYGDSFEVPDDLFR